MSSPSDHPDSSSHLRIEDGSSSASPQQRRLRLLGTAVLGAALLLAILPFFITSAKPSQIVTFALGLGMIALLDLGFGAILLAWRSTAGSRLGEWQFTVEGFQSSQFRNLIFSGTMQCVAIFLLWLPLLGEADAKNSSSGLVLFMVLSGFSAVASVPWLVQLLVNVKGHDLEVHAEGLMIGGFYPCRWQRITSYHVWQDACSYITFHIRGRGPVEVFMSPIDCKLLCEVLEKQVGPPASQGRSSDYPDGRQAGQFGQLSIFQ
ncbi:hypothetical protein DTL42_23270 [Bremerella cremea]|uniref:Uncharacterized protein n=1 Tax=Bremerella cremea TaxID=1031537 RepID=A0A368KL44_9BACT|nr:hypothetical protein [Bremerella cremea]RCS41477.1 hypothetical protein DTL42_23270 [Bremerella cremea]